MMRAIWNGVVIAETPRTRRVEGNDYFPPESLGHEYFTESATKSLCPWKGVARYYTLTVNGRVNPDAAWYYPHPTPLARHIKNHVAFWNGVVVEGTREKKPGRQGCSGPSRDRLKCRLFTGRRGQ